MDFYIDDVDKMGNHFTGRIDESESGSSQYAYYKFDFGVLNTYANNGAGLTDGWNDIKIPLSAMSLNVDTSYFGSDYTDFLIDKITFFCQGSDDTGADNQYLIKYDNLYVTDKSNIDSMPDVDLRKSIYLTGKETWSGTVTWDNEDSVVGDSSLRFDIGSAGTYNTEYALPASMALNGGDYIDLNVKISNTTAVSSILFEFSSSGTFDDECARYSYSGTGAQSVQNNFANNKWTEIKLCCPGPKQPDTAGRTENGYRLYLGSSQTDDQYPDWGSINYVRIVVFADREVTVKFNGMRAVGNYTMFSESGEEWSGLSESSDAMVGDTSYEVIYDKTGTKVMAQKALADSISLDPGSKIGLWVYLNDVSLVREIYFEFGSAASYSNKCARYLFGTNSAYLIENTFSDGWTYVEFTVPESGVPDTAGRYENGYRLYLGSGQSNGQYPDWSQINYFRFIINTQNNSSSNPLTVRLNGLDFSADEAVFVSNIEEAETNGNTYASWSSSSFDGNTYALELSPYSSGEISVGHVFSQPVSAEYGQYMGLWVYVNDVSLLNGFSLKVGSIEGSDRNAVVYKIGENSSTAVGRSFTDGWNYLKFFVPDDGVPDSQGIIRGGYSLSLAGNADNSRCTLWDSIKYVEITADVQSSDARIMLNSLTIEQAGEADRLPDNYYEAENNGYIKTDGQWTVSNYTAYSGGKVLYSSQLGSKATFAFYGTGFSVIGYAA
ncbi:MAG: hypothetical protein ACI4QV_04885, partial [Acutalibacteraceae bacterium]